MTKMKTNVTNFVNLSLTSDDEDIAPEAKAYIDVISALHYDGQT